MKHSSVTRSTAPKVVPEAGDRTPPSVPESSPPDPTLTSILSETRHDVAICIEKKTVCTKQMLSSRSSRRPAGVSTIGADVGDLGADDALESALRGQTRPGARLVVGGARSSRPSRALSFALKPSMSPTPILRSVTSTVVSSTALRLPRELLQMPQTRRSAPNVAVDHLHLDVTAPSSTRSRTPPIPSI